MLTAVLKLLQIVQPDRVFFGEKDYQQLVLVRQMAADLHLDVQVVGVPIVREPDGLAMSSRNRYLDPAQREARRRCRRRCWRQARRLGGASAAVDAARAVLDAVPAIDVDYLQVRDPRWALPPRMARRLLVAAGSARPDSWTTSPSKSELSPAATDGCPPAIGSANHVGGIDVTDHAQI
ncbi:pantothenate synthetase [Mycobacterium xenopi 3993]|nr:pantothenate synthetase [Mycobacterium xenopi 3993]